MPKKVDGSKLTEKEVEEIHRLRNDGCPCCKVPIPVHILAEKYGASSSTVSRIGTSRYVSDAQDPVQNGAGR